MAKKAATGDEIQVSAFGIQTAGYKDDKLVLELPVDWVRTSPAVDLSVKSWVSCEPVPL